MSTRPRDELTPEEREGLSAGRHEQVAAELHARDRPDLAGWVLEQIWAWEPAHTAYERAGRPLDALRVAVESGAVKSLDATLSMLEEHPDAAVVDRAIAWLEQRRRPLEAARLMRRRNDMVGQARALAQAGSDLAAARTLAKAGKPREALEMLTRHGAVRGTDELGLAAELAWDLGDAEGAAHFAQQCLREGGPRRDVETVLARSLVALGHDLAAQMVLRGDPESSPVVAIPARYQVQAAGPPGLVGSVYLGIDRRSLQEVEIHLLLAEHGEIGTLDAQILAALERFAAIAHAAAELGHPAIRPILRIDVRAGILVLPRAEGPPLRALIRAPGMEAMPSRARALVAFLLEGLQVAHVHGLVHGWLLPSQIVCDAAGRPTLGPFGAHHLAGLAATHTGSLEELMATTAPELRGGHPPTAQSDVYAAGVLLQALLCGTLGNPDQRGETPEYDLAAAMTARDPEARPDIDTVLAQLRAPIADLRDLGWGSPGPSPTVSTPGTNQAMDARISVTAHASWTDEELDAVCKQSSPWVQPILDRVDRTVVLASWPEGSQTLAPGVSGFRERLSPQALEFDGGLGREALAARLRSQSLVRTPSGTWMIALDDLLNR